MLKDKWLKLDLQTFSDNPEGAEDITDKDSTNEEGGANDSSTGTQNTDTSSDNTASQKIPYDRFKAKVDEANALKAKLDAIEAEKEAEKTKQLEEQNEYKTLYEQAIAQVAEFKQEAVNTKKRSLLQQVGYNDEQVAQLLKLVDGDSDDAIALSVETIKATFPVKPAYVDPSVDNGMKQKPATKDATDLGRSLYERLRGKKGE